MIVQVVVQCVQDEILFDFGNCFVDDYMLNCVSSIGGVVGDVGIGVGEGRIIWYVDCVWINFVVRGQQNCMVYCVFQFVDVICLFVGQQLGVGGVGNWFFFDLVGCGVFFYEMIGQGDDVGWVFVQWWQGQIDDIQVEEQVFVESFVGNGFVQILVGCCQDVDIDFDWFGVVNVVDFMFLDCMQQFGLQLYIYF